MSGRPSGAGAALCALLLAACASAPPAARPTIALEASRALSEGFAALQCRPERFEDARLALRRASALAPDWVAPRRLLDDVERFRLAGVEALRRHRLALQANPSDASELYLAGRLEGEAGARRFQDALRYDPALSWARHGLAQTEAEHDLRAAVGHTREALERARDPWERAYFTAALAKLLARRDRAGEREGLQLLESLASDASGAERERTQLRVTAVEIGLSSSGPRTRERAYEQGLALLREHDVSDAELLGLVPRLKNSLYVDDLDGTQLALALDARAGRVRERLRAEVVASPLARVLVERQQIEEGRAPAASRRARGERLPSADFAGTIEAWRSALPRVVVDESGMPRDRALARVVEAARALAGDGETGRVEALAQFGDALVAAGWYREVRAVVARLARLDPERARGLEDRALAGSSVLDGLERLARRSDRRAARTPSPDPDGESRASRPVRTLSEFLDGMAPLFAQAAPWLAGLPADEEAVRRAIRASPRMEYAGVAELVHPGPGFSAADERAGLGREGGEVGGLAALFRAIHRFAIVGSVSGGGGPDAGVLPLLWLEWRSGEHLGVPWQGTVAWCEEADLKSRAARMGAQISAAALHEGYWVDVDAVREELVGWNALARRFGTTPDAADEVARILATSGFTLDGRAEAEDRRARDALLGEAHRVRLAVLRDRARDGAVLGELTLEDLLETTAIHEEGHLCDRTRFLPIWDHKFAILGFLAQCNFSPQRVAEELEYRAQLTCLCDAPDPRIPLAQVLDAGESGGPALTAHGPGYLRLLDDFLRALDERLQREPEWCPRIDRSRTLGHQIHSLAPESVREIARAVARRRRM